MTNAEILLALRSPRSGWLAAVVCAMDEAMLDASFDETHRSVLMELLERRSIPAAVALSAHANLLNFESAAQSRREARRAPECMDVGVPRQKLTLAVSN